MTQRKSVSTLSDNGTGAPHVQSGRLLAHSARDPPRLPMSPRRSLDQTRTFLLDNGVELLLAKGVEATVGSIPLIDVCRHAGLTTAGSAYKIWATQDDFRTDLLRHALAIPTNARKTVEPLICAIVDGKADTIRELNRIASAHNATLNMSSEHYRLFVALWCAAGSEPVLAQNIQESDASLLRDFTVIYENLIAGYGRVWNPPFNAALLATTLSALLEGLTIRARYAPDRVPADLIRPTGPDGSDQTWHLFACAAEAILELFTSPVHDSSPG